MNITPRTYRDRAGCRICGAAAVIGVIGGCDRRRLLDQFYRRQRQGQDRGVHGLKKGIGEQSQDQADDRIFYHAFPLFNLAAAGGRNVPEAADHDENYRKDRRNADPQVKSRAQVLGNGRLREPAY